jgi:hypothetical protein
VEGGSGGQITAKAAVNMAERERRARSFMGMVVLSLGCHGCQRLLVTPKLQVLCQSGLATPPWGTRRSLTFLTERKT